MHARRGYKLLSSAFSEEETLSDQVSLTLHRWYKHASLGGKVCGHLCMTRELHTLVTPQCLPVFFCFIWSHTLFFPLGERKPINSHFLFILPLQSVQLFDAIPTMLFAFSKEISIYLLHGWVPISLSLSLLSELPFTFISCLSQGWQTEAQTALKMQAHN